MCADSGVILGPDDPNKYILGNIGCYFYLKAFA